MAVVANAFVSAGLFVPFRTAKRGGDNGSDAVGTLSVDANATGAAGGGTVTITINMTKSEFGFRCLWVPTIMVVSDDLAAAEVVEMAFSAGGNERLSTSLTQAQLLVAGGSQNAGNAYDSAVLIDPDQVVAAEVLRAVWSTNTDTKGYHFHVYGPVFDGELLALNNSIGDLLAGLR